MRLTLAVVLLGMAGAAPLRTATAGSATSVPALVARAQVLEDATAVRKLQRAYGYYLDRGYWDEAAALFADNARFEWGLDGVYVGKARIREYLIRQGGGNPGPGLPYGQYNHHLQLQPVVDIGADGHTAHARWRELALLGQYKVSAAWGTGVYENDYTKENGVWRIQSLHFYLTFLAPYEGGWAKLSAAGADWRSAVARAFPPDLPSTERYSTFPDHFTAPFHRTDAARAVRARRSPDEEEARLILLESRDQIQNLQALYGYDLDAGLWSRAAGLFAAQATYEFGQQGVYVGRAHIRAALGLMGPEGLAPGQLNLYIMLQPIIDVAGDNRTAKARWRSDVLLAQNGHGEWGEGTYENTYVNEHGHWLIQSLHFYPTFFADYDLGWARGSRPLPGPATRPAPDRPPSESFQSFPEVYLPAYHYPNPVTGAQPAQDFAATSDPVRRSLRQHITRLEDQVAIERLQRAYGYYVDKLQWPQVADLFAADATLEIGGRGIFVGKPHILAYLGSLGEPRPQRGLLMNHQQFAGIVDVDADGHGAAGRWTAFVMAGRSPDADWGDVTYENRYVKQGGIWKLQTLHAPFQMYTHVSAGWGKVASPNTRPDSWEPPPDLPPRVVENSYPSFYVEPYHYLNPVTGQPMPAPNPAAGGVAPMITR